MDRQRNENHIVAFILVKSTSQRLPNKNFLEINGVPLWLRSVKLALGEPLIKRVIIVAEHKDGFDRIEQEIFKLGANVSKSVIILIREPELCKPETTSTAVLLWAATIADKCMEYEHILLLQATTPLLRSPRLHDCLALYKEAAWANLVTVNPTTMKEDGEIYIINRKLFRQTRQLMTDELIVAHSRRMVWGPIDIDRPEDYYIAKAILEGRSI